MPRIEADTADTAAQTIARRWRLDHLNAYEAARSWLARDAEIIDTTAAQPAEVAALIAGRPAR